MPKKTDHPPYSRLTDEEDLYNPQAEAIKALLDGEKEMRSGSLFDRYSRKQPPKKPWYSFLFCCSSEPEEPDQPNGYTKIPNSPRK